MEKLVIQSDINNLIEVERFVCGMCDNYNVNNYTAAISMSVLQAAENAIVHGNNSDSSKHVTITSDFCKGGIYFCVSDEGVGFNYSEYNGSLPEEEKGTGLFLMRTLSDNLVFSNNGSTVKLEFKINGIESTRALERIVVLKNFYARQLVTA